MPSSLNEIITFICPKCNREYNMSKAQKLCHIRWCNKDELGNNVPKFKKINFQDIDWDKIQNEYNNSSSWDFVIKKLNISRNIIRYGKNNNLLSKNKKFYHTDETKKKLSEIKLTYFKNNPDKHIWKKNDKFISKPCEYVKELLHKENISFVEEYQPLDDRMFSIDIAFPNDKIGIEINGNQHYNNDGSLKDYYSTRHQLIENEGWKLYEIHYSLVYKNDFKDLLYKIINKLDVSVIYNNERKPNKNLICPICGNHKSYKADVCEKCYKNNQRKHLPSKEQLIQDITTMSMVSVGKKYDVSDNAVRKWCKSYDIYDLRKNKLGN